MATPYDDMWEAFRDASRGGVTDEGEVIFKQLFQMTVQPALAGTDGPETWGKARDWVLKQTGKIAREASSQAEKAGNSALGANEVAAACNKMIPLMHGSCEKALEGSSEASYGAFCPLLIVLYLYCVL